MSDKAGKKRASRLGRGLSSLMSPPVHMTVEVDRRGQVTAVPVGESAPSHASDQAAEHRPVRPEQPPETGGLRYVAVEALSPNPYQPRQRFEEKSLQHLAESIRADGLMQPIIARPAPGSSAGLTGQQAYEIVAGERRWRAAKLAGLTQIPAIIRELDDRQAAEWSLIENLQREDLNPMDRAEALHRLCEQHSLSHEQVAERVGLERSTVSNLLRLLTLSDPVRDLVRQELLSMGQARAIAGLSQPAAQEALAGRAIREDLSVREVEKLARHLGAAARAEDATAGGPSAPQGTKPAHLRDLENQLAAQLGTKVQLTTGRKKGTGKLTIAFYSLDQFDAILHKLGVEIG